MLVDNRSKHLWDVVSFLRSRNLVTVRVDPFKCNIKKIKTEGIDGIILSGGGRAEPLITKKRDFNFNVIRLFKNKPILGICLGHEFLIEYYRGALYKMNWRAQGFTYINITKDNELIEGKKRLYVYKGHSYAAGRMPDCFEQLAWSADCENEMIEHNKRPHFGVQFHPEMNPSGQIILDNFLKLCKRNAI